MAEEKEWKHPSLPVRDLEDYKNTIDSMNSFQQKMRELEIKADAFEELLHIWVYEEDDDECIAQLDMTFKQVKAQLKQVGGRS